jgi:hypothetical protein
LYVTGFDDGSFDCVFIGSDLDLVSSLKDKPLNGLFSYDLTFRYLDNEFKALIDNNLVNGTIITDKGIDYEVHMNTPSLIDSENVQEARKISNFGIFWKLNDIIKAIFEQEGFELESNLLDSQEKVVYSKFDGHKAIDSFEGVTIVPTQNREVFNLGSQKSSSFQTFQNTTDKHIELNDSCTEIRVRMRIDYEQDDSLISTQIRVDVRRETFTPQIDPVKVSSFIWDGGSILLNGINYYDFVAKGDFTPDDYIEISYNINPTPNTSYPLTANYKLEILEAIITTDMPLPEGNILWYGDYVDNVSQFDFLKGILNDFNLVLDIEGNKAKLELQDDGRTLFPIGNIAGMATEIEDITNKIEWQTNINIDYLQAGLLQLKQNYLSSDLADAVGTLVNQEMGSFLFRLNSYNTKGIETFESYFNTAYNNTDIREVVVSEMKITFYDSWEKLIMWRDEKTLEEVELLDEELEFIDIYQLRGRFNRFSYTWNKLFKNTLELRKNNKIKSVNLYDHNGDIMSFRKKYQIRNQTYKLLEFEFDVVSKLVKAKLELA